MRPAPRVFLANAIAPSMLPDARATLDFAEIDLDAARCLAVGAVSHVGHADTAARYAELLGRPVAVDRAPLTLAAGDVLLIGQHDQSRLPEGATTLAERAAFRWVRITRSA